MVTAIDNNVPRFSGTANPSHIFPISKDCHPKLFTIASMCISDYYKKQTCVDSKKVMKSL